MNEIKLRDKRKPGHCWQDNELYDCFQPVIGPIAVGVYTRLTRECYGAAVKISLRDLAALTGISKSAVGRAMSILESIGMVVIRRGAPKRVQEYDLADLKELAIHYGAIFDHKRSSYILSPESIVRLRSQTSLLTNIPVNSPNLHNTVPNRDSGLSSRVPIQRVSVPQKGQSCPRNTEKSGAPLINKKERIQEKTPLPPLQGGDEDTFHNIPTEAAMRAAWDGVLKDLHNILVNPTLPPNVDCRLRGEEDWFRYFSNLELIFDSSMTDSISSLLLRAPNPSVAQLGLDKYRRRIDNAMQKYFGRSIPITIIDTS